MVAVYHDRADLDMDINACFLRLVLETRDHAHVEEIKGPDRRRLQAGGQGLRDMRCHSSDKSVPFRTC